MRCDPALVPLLSATLNAAACVAAWFWMAAGPQICSVPGWPCSSSHAMRVICCCLLESALTLPLGVRARGKQGVENLGNMWPEKRSQLARTSWSCLAGCACVHLVAACTYVQLTACRFVAVVETFVETRRPTTNRLAV